MTMTRQQIQVGATVRIVANGNVYEQTIEAVEGGQITVKAARSKSRGRWWLPVDFVQKHGTLLNPPPRRMPSVVKQQAAKPGQKAAEPTRSEVSRVMAEMGRRGGRVGGKARAATMPPEQRAAQALKAARARWDKSPAPAPSVSRSEPGGAG